MEVVQGEYDEVSETQMRDYSVLDRHIRQLTLLSKVSNSGITVFDMHTRRHVFTSYNFADLFHYDLDEIATADSAYFDSRIHPDDIEILRSNGVACMQYLMNHKDVAQDAKLINEYRLLLGESYVRVIEQFQVLEFDKAGDMWLSLSMLDISPNQHSDTGVNSRLLNYRTGEVYPFLAADKPVLSEREREILSLIGQGKLSKEIADKLVISVHTVNTHRQRILEKLNADNSIEAVRYASRLGLLD